ncbi:MAG: polyprenyl synthetase family protein [Proteobacteria bacterium]|nr:polyprenyl synthetase family protein [Pseudomonadota bacterium]
MIDDFEPFRERVIQQLEIILNHTDAPSPLIEAMRYGVLSGGKRIRPILVYLSCKALGADLSLADKPACAIELIHAYSLIHDDLPAMDNDDLRRGEPACHIKFGEATAILAGDALQTLAFEILANDHQLTAETRLSLITELAAATGASGMVAGQIIDLGAENRFIDAVGLENMHRRKTGDLISTCLIFGAILSAADTEVKDAMLQFGQALGLAFQIKDDILDVTGDERAIGKPVGSDVGNEKTTFVSVYGLDEATCKLDQLLGEATAALVPLGRHAAPLNELARFIINRDH